MSVIKTCKKCKLQPSHNMWWEDNIAGWVCYDCGMGRKQEQLKREIKWRKDNGQQILENTTDNDDNRYSYSISYTITGLYFNSNK